MAKNKKLITVEDIWALQRVGGLSLSPDGAQAVCSVASFSMEDNNSSTSLWLLNTFGGEPRRLTSAGDKDGQPAWSPQGDRIAFVAKREQQGKKDDTPQLYVMAPDGGEAQRVSNFACGIEAFKWFPDGKRIGFISWVWPEEKGSKAQAKRHKEFKDRKETGYVTSEAQYRFWDHNLPMGRVPHLHVLDVASGRVRDLFEGTDFELPRSDADTNAFDISPDGKTIVFAFDPAAEKRLDHCKALITIDVRSGKTHTAAQDAAWDFDAPRYCPTGQQIAFIASHQGLKHTMPGQLSVLEVGVGFGGAWAVVSADWDHNVNAPLRWSADAAAVLFTAEDHGRCNLYRFELAARTAALVVQGGWVQGFDVAGDVVVSAADAMNHPTHVNALRADSPPVRIEKFNDAAMATFKLGTTEDVRLKGANGDEVQMWVIYPPGFDPKKTTKKYPVMNNIHGGPHAAAGDTFHYRWNNQVFAAQGYIVAGVNYHGSSGFGYAFLDSITHRWGELELQDVEAGTDWLLAKPWVDKKRIFATGGSYGGYMVAWMNGHVPAGRYQAYVCHAGCFDWQAMFADDAYTWHAKELGAWYWVDAAKVASQSPSTFVAAMQTPTLVIHGALDYRVPDGQGLAYYNTLKAKGVDSRLLWFPDENHWILKPRNSKLWYGEFFDWLKAHDNKPKAAKPAKKKSA
jgi:dipeptidyl aminopeptidase/acylaminoacyl peptidase